MKRRTFNIAMHGGGLVPCTGYEFDANGFTLVVHHEFLGRQKLFGKRWEVSDPVSGRGLLGIGYTSRRKDAIAHAQGYAKRVGQAVFAAMLKQAAGA